MLQAPRLVGLQSPAAAREGFKHLPSENKQELTVEPDHSQILWQIHQLAADVICIRDYGNLSMSGKQPNLVSDGRSSFSICFPGGTWDLVGPGMEVYRENCTNTLIHMITPSLWIHVSHLYFRVESERDYEH
ncbi:hypothetical protein PBY51_024737 [Eleginops maclovinus]|uniref:Uncharacterized protein n=1 Tax=Eleginops maclovinus TaxID=56733 RepID=A0AAN7Y026_ELEMC|nr:hypothetical protein PBY51_024737 [Eleginops maclovinus]